MSPAGDIGGARRPGIGEQDAMPIVERPSSGLTTPVIIFGAAVLGLLLFVWLDARLTRISTPATTARQLVAADTAPPPLYIPPAFEAAPASDYPPALPPQALAPPTAVAASPPPARLPAPIFSQPPAPYPPSPFAPIAPAGRDALPRPSGGSVVVFDRGGDARSQAITPSGGGGPATTSGETSVGQVRARAGMFANRATTVPQGTLIPAILETGFDSTRAGSARALVQRDVRGFDGTRILIPRGSRLLGDYQSDVAAGQKRALILWTRLIRPDGGTIALASPVTDPAGRTGVRARVDTHFFERFSNAFLQTALNVGAGVATRRSDNSVVLALPGSFQGASNTIAPAATEIKPTLSLKPGTSISVLAARDLDFTDVEPQP